MLIHLKQEMNYSYFEHSFFQTLFVSSHLEWLEAASTPQWRKVFYIVILLVFLMKNKIFKGTCVTSEEKLLLKLEQGHTGWIIYSGLLCSLSITDLGNNNTFKKLHPALNPSPTLQSSCQQPKINKPYWQVLNPAVRQFDISVFFFNNYMKNYHHNIPPARINQLVTKNTKSDSEFVNWCLWVEASLPLQNNPHALQNQLLLCMFW